VLSRYKMFRGKRPADDPLPDGVRIDTRKHTRHFLRPNAETVESYLAAPDGAAWKIFRSEYRAELGKRFATDRGPFDELVEQAQRENVFIGCSCPTAKNPDVQHCHTMLALEFLGERYPDLEIVRPALHPANG